MTLANVNVSKNFLLFLENLGLLEDQETIRDVTNSLPRKIYSLVEVSEYTQVFFPEDP